MTYEQGSFAQKTILQRKPHIQQVIVDNDYPAFVVERLMHFKDEIDSRLIQPLTEEAPDVAQWNGIWREFEGRTWLLCRDLLPPPATGGHRIFSPSRSL